LIERITALLRSHPKIEIKAQGRCRGIALGHEGKDGNFKLTSINPAFGVACGKTACDAHECGHAVQDALKPNVDHDDPGYKTWTESFVTRR
jgi:hypothetical protein